MKSTQRLRIFTRRVGTIVARQKSAETSWNIKSHKNSYLYT